VRNSSRGDENFVGQPRGCDNSPPCPSRQTAFTREHISGLMLAEIILAIRG